MTTLERRREILNRLLGVASGRAELAEVDCYLSPEVRVHMDAWSFRGISPWGKWIRYSLAASGVEDPRYPILAAEEDGDRVRVRIAGQGRRDGEAVVAEPVWVTYRFAGDRVAEIWTRRQNYVFFFGDRIRNPVCFVWLMLRIVVWCWLEDVRRP